MNLFCDSSSNTKYYAIFFIIFLVFSVSSFFMKCVCIQNILSRPIQVYTTHTIYGFFTSKYSHREKLVNVVVIGAEYSTEVQSKKAFPFTARQYEIIFIFVLH